MNNPRRIQRHLVKALAAGALLAAAALPMAIAGVAGAAGGTITSVAFTPHGTTANSFGQGGSGNLVISGSGFAASGGTVTVTSSAPGLTFSGATEPAGGATVDASFASTAATVPGSYSITVTDSNGVSTLASAFSVDAAPTVTSLAPTSLSQGNAPVLVALTGTGITTGATVTFTSTVDGTSLASAAGNTFTGGVVTTPANQGTATMGNSGTTLSAYVSPTNSVNGSPATPGTYTETVVNGDGGTTTLAGGFTITAYGITDVSPSALPESTPTADTSVTIAGAGFEFGATVTLTGCSGVSVASSTVNSASSITAVVAVTGVSTTELCGLTVANTGAGLNGASFSLAGALGIGQGSTVAPVITATSATTPLVPGAPASTITFTGTGFSQYSSAEAFVGTTTTPVATNVTISNPSGNTGTAVTFNVGVNATGAIAGPYNVQVFNTLAGSNNFPAAFSVAGPTITSQSPTGIAVGAPAGTVITLTGTGFTNTTNGVVASAGGSMAGIVSYVSATTMNLVLTASPNATDLASPPSVNLTQFPATGGSVTSTFLLTIDAAPAVTSAVTYTVGTDVGVGAVAQQVVFHGIGFATGATVSKFVNGNGTADPNVTATVTSITPTTITATIAIAAGDANLADGYSVTNTDGGVDAVSAIAFPVVIGAGPTVTAVTPSPVLASATNAITITGTGFETGAVVSATSNGTCGTATVVSATSITVSCTFGVAQTVAVSLVVTNTDGGSATSAVVLPASAPPAKKRPAPPFRVTGAHGHAVAGRTVTMVISGTGFFGQPRITSNAAGTRVTVSKDNGHLLVIRVTTKVGTSGHHLFTIRLANGKTGRASYVVVK